MKFYKNALLIILEVYMKRIIYIFLIISVICISVPSADAFSVSGRVSPAYTVGRSRYMAGNNIYANRYMNQKRYIYTPQQAKYNGFRTGIEGNGYNNTYYYNRYRK